MGEEIIVLLTSAKQTHIHYKPNKRI